MHIYAMPCIRTYDSFVFALCNHMRALRCVRACHVGGGAFVAASAAVFVAAASLMPLLLLLFRARSPGLMLCVCQRAPPREPIECEYAEPNKRTHKIHYYRFPMCVFRHMAELTLLIFAPTG